MRVSRSDLGLWAELADLGIVDAQASAWTRAALALRDLTGLPEVEPAVEAELRPYQLDGFRWLAFLWRSGLGGILADDMGLGKTLQTLALVAHARGEGAAPFLVVAPTSVVATWAHEAATFVPGLTTRADHRVTGPTRAWAWTRRWPAPTSWSPPTRSTGWRPRSTPRGSGAGWCSTRPRR